MSPTLLKASIADGCSQTCSLFWFLFLFKKIISILMCWSFIVIHLVYIGYLLIIHQTQVFCFLPVCSIMYSPYSKETSSLTTTLIFYVHVSMSWAELSERPGTFTIHLKPCWASSLCETVGKQQGCRVCKAECWSPGLDAHWNHWGALKKMGPFFCIPSRIIQPKSH